MPLEQISNFVADITVFPPCAQPCYFVQKTSAQAPEGLDARVCAQRFARS